MRTNNSQPAGLGWVILSLCLSIPWLIPAHTEPWATLYSEVAAALAVVPIAAWLAWKQKDGLPVDALTLGFALCALIPPLQAVSGLYLFPAESYLVSYYLVGISVTVAVARHTESVTPGRLLETLFASLVIASLASVALALAQWANLDWGYLLASAPDRSRTVANIGQSNELSTLLIWGLIGVWWGYLNHRIGGHVSAMAAATILLGIASTQSRTGWLAVGILYLVALWAPCGIDRPRQKRVFTALTFWFYLLALAVPAARHVFDSGVPGAPSPRLTIGLRPQIWSMMIDGILDRPWAGYGWNQGRLVQLLELPQYDSIKIGVQHAHNLILDLLVWNGIPLGITISIALAAWFVWQVRQAKSAAQLLPLLALSTFSLHAMLELPHCKAFFLLPVAMMMGVLNAQVALQPDPIRLPRPFTSLLAVFFAATLILTWFEYQRIELDLQTYRIRAARVGVNKPAPPSPDIYMLYGLQSALLSLRIEPRANMSTDDLERLRVVSTRYPIESALFRYAKAAFLNGHEQEVITSLTRWCQLFPEDRCNAARSAWDDLLKEHGEISPVPFPPFNRQIGLR